MHYSVPNLPSRRSHWNKSVGSIRQAGREFIFAAKWVLRECHPKFRRGCARWASAPPVCKRARWLAFLQNCVQIFLAIHNKKKRYLHIQPRYVHFGYNWFVLLLCFSHQLHGSHKQKFSLTRHQGNVITYDLYCRRWISIPWIRDAHISTVCWLNSMGLQGGSALS